MAYGPICTFLLRRVIKTGHSSFRGIYVVVEQLSDRFYTIASLKEAIANYVFFTGPRFPGSVPIHKSTTEISLGVRPSEMLPVR
jgi:hypothetical protein